MQCEHGARRNKHPRLGVKRKCPFPDIHHPHTYCTYGVLDSEYRGSGPQPFNRSPLCFFMYACRRRIITPFPVSLMPKEAVHGRRFSFCSLSALPTSLAPSVGTILSLFVRSCWESSPSFCPTCIFVLCQHGKTPGQAGVAPPPLLACRLPSQPHH